MRTILVLSAAMACSGSGTGVPAGCPQTASAADAHNLTGVFSVAPGSAFASSKGGTIWRWNGTAWSVSYNGTTCSLNAVWGSGGSDVWVVGDGGTVLHWDGSAWSARASGVSLPLHAVWGTAPSDVWMVGDSGVGTMPLVAAVLHWDGGAFSSQNPGVNLNGVWADTPADVWIVGGTSHAFQYAVRGGPTEFQSVVIGIGGGPIGHIFGTGPSDVWADSQHFDGVAWSTPSPGPAGTAIWATGPTNAWGVGNGISHWDGSAWSSAALGGSTSAFAAVSGSGASDVWAVGPASATAHFDGTSWTVSPL